MSSLKMYDKMRLSIIIPVYNVEAYVGKMLESVFNTTASADDFEVIVVNDGTKDGSMDVVRQFTDKPNLTVIEQENHGLGAARMKGLSVAKGEYVWFVDSDDWLVEDGVGRVLTLLADLPEADVLMFPLHWVFEDGAKDDRYDYSRDNVVVTDGKTVIKDLGLEVVGSTRFVIPRSLFLDTRLFFPKGVLFEDVYFGGVLVIVSRQFHVQTEPVYNYRIRTGSIMNALNIRSSYDMVSVHKMVMRFKEQSIDQSDWLWFDSYFYRHLQYAYTRMKPHFRTREFRTFARKHGFYVWRQFLKVHREASWKTKLKFLYGFMCPVKLKKLLSI